MGWFGGTIIFGNTPHTVTYPLKKQDQIVSSAVRLHLDLQQYCGFGRALRVLLKVKGVHLGSQKICKGWGKSQLLLPLLGDRLNRTCGTTDLVNFDAIDSRRQSMALVDSGGRVFATRCPNWQKECDGTYVSGWVLRERLWEWGFRCWGQGGIAWKK